MTQVTLSHDRPRSRSLRADSRAGGGAGDPGTLALTMNGVGIHLARRGSGDRGYAYAVSVLALGDVVANAESQLARARAGAR